MDQDQGFQTVAIADMAAQLVRHVAQIEGDAKIKIAALRASAAVIEQAVFAAGVTAIVAQSLTPKT